MSFSKPGRPAAAPPVTLDPQAGRGIALMALGTLMIPGMDAIAKTLGTGDPAAPAVQLVFYRFLIQIAALAPVVIALGGWRALRLTRPALMLGRGLLIAGASIFFFASLQVMPMAETVAIFFVEPLILTLLSALFLGERIGWRRLSAVAAGLIGALLIIRPGAGALGWSATLPLGAALCFAFYLLLTKAAAREDPWALQFWAAASAAGAMGALMLAGAWLSASGVESDVVRALSHIALRPDQWALLGAMGLIGTAAHMLVVFAFRDAPAATLAPFQYLEIVSATALGWLVFGDFPDPRSAAGSATWAGVALIVAAGLFVFQRERRIGLQPPPEESR